MPTEIAQSLRARAEEAAGQNVVLHRGLGVVALALPQHGFMDHLVLLLPEPGEVLTQMPPDIALPITIDGRLGWLCTLGAAKRYTPRPTAETPRTEQNQGG